MCIEHISYTCLDHYMVMTAMQYNIIYQAAESVFMVFDDTIDNEAYCSFLGYFLVLALLWRRGKETTNSDLANTYAYCYW